MRNEGVQDLVQARRLQGFLLRLHPGIAGRRNRRDFLGSFAQILTNMIEINQVAALLTELLLDLAGDPRRAVAHRMHPRVRPEARPNRAGQERASRRLDTALDHAAIHRRSAALAVRQRNLRLPP